MPAPVIYRSTDASAPVLTGEVGSLIALLDACLVNGYGSKAAAGWTKEFSGTNKAGYRPPAGNRFYLRVDDNAPGATALAKEAGVRGYETMSDVDTGTGPFPTVAQQANPGLWARKSSTADATARTWVLAADDRTLHLFIMTGDTVGRYIQPLNFGDLYSFATSDAHHTLISSRSAENSTLINRAFDASPANPTIGSVEINLARIATGTGGSVLGNFFGNTGTNNATYFDFPNGVDGYVYLERRLISDTSIVRGIRGYVRGYYQILNGGTGVADGDTFSGTGDFAGRTFEVVKPVGGSTTRAIAIETTPWDTR